MNITLPRELGLKVKASKNSSALIAESLQEKFDRQDKESLNKKLEIAYADAAMSNEDQGLWDTTIGDGLNSKGTS